MRRAGLAVWLALGATAVTSGAFAVGRLTAAPQEQTKHFARGVGSTTAVKPTPAITCGVAPTTTTIPATTVTTTVPLVSVPDAVAAAADGLAFGEMALARVGLGYAIARVDSGACYFTFEPGVVQWNTNKPLSQTPPAGKLVPPGTTVTIDAC